MVAEETGKPVVADYQQILTALSAVAETRREMEESIKTALRLKGGWREAIVELEDFCSEPVRLQNMLCAADQLDEWATKARAILSKLEE